MEIQMKWVAPAPAKTRGAEDDANVAIEAVYKIAVRMRDMYYTDQVHTEDDEKLIGQILNGGRIGPSTLIELVDLIDRVKAYHEGLDTVIMVSPTRARNVDNLNQWKWFLEMVIRTQKEMEASYEDVDDCLVGNDNPFHGEGWLDTVNDLPLLADCSLKGT
jgi:hypothetical protein